VKRLLEEGRSPETPVAAVRWGTRADQRTVIGTLRDIVVKAEQARLEPPTVIVIGEVVNLREQLNWFEKRPLFGRRIVLTRAQEQVREFSQLLAAYGAEPIEAPTIQIVPPASWRAIDQAIVGIADYHWLMFTSVNGVKPFMDRLRTAGRDSRALAHLQICAIGPRTAEELARYGVTPDLVPSEYQAEGVLAALSAHELRGKKILIPRAEVARELLPEQLRRMGAGVDVITVYRTIVPAADMSRLRELIEACKIDMVTFTSSSTVRNFVDMVGGSDEARHLGSKTTIGCIGPITAQQAEECGLTVALVPPENTVPALAQAIVRHFSEGVRIGVSASR
jgi:uroporphyrinogen III methyltransferase / synthase